jgi:hypothetical protein
LEDRRRRAFSGVVPQPRDTSHELVSRRVSAGEVTDAEFCENGPVLLSVALEQDKSATPAERL